MVDAHTRRIVGIYLTFDPPSYRSNMMVIRDCVRRTGRLPQIIVVDGGSDFSGAYFQMLAAAFKITIKTRPGSEPRFGSVIERLFNTANKQLVHLLTGNTQIARNVRQITKQNDPKRLAVWSLAPLYDALCDWAFRRYDTEEHWTLKRSPRDTYFSALRLTGMRRHRLIRYDDEFKILTMPSTRKETAKYVPGRGFKVNHEYYRCSEFEEAEIEGEQIAVRYDPFKYGVAYAYVKDRWVRCVANNYHLLEGRTEREQALMSAEKRMRDRRFSRGLMDRAAQRALDHRADQESEREQSEKLRLLRRKELENSAVIRVISGSSSARLTPDKEDDIQRTQQEGANREHTPSFFSEIDLSRLGALEVYK